MGLMSFLFFQCKTAFNVNTCHVISKISQLFPLFDVDLLEIANCSDITIVFYPLGSFGQALCTRSCHEDLLLTWKSHNCAKIAFIQGESAGDSKLSEQTLADVVFAYLHFNIPLTSLIGLAVEMYRMKRLLNFLETYTLLIQQKITEKVGLYLVYK